MYSPAVLLVLAAPLLAAPAAGQTFATADPVLETIWREGMESSQVYRLAQTLLDSIGPRLTGSPGIESGQEWLVETYREWGIDARNEPYGEWMRWRRGRTHVDLVTPRVRTLEATMLAWSPGTNGRTVRGEVVVLPDVTTRSAFDAWLPEVEGKFVAISYPQPTCRPDADWAQWSTEASFERLTTRRTAARRAFQQRIERAGHTARSLAGALENAGAAGIISSRWSNGWGVQKIFNARTERIPTVDVSCEDYGLLARLAENGQHPTIELTAEAQFLGVGPVFNTIAVIPGTELPGEYVMLSAHFDSWDGSSGATDNGTGTTIMLEAMRIVKQVYPNPRRTIVVGHWSGEEQGLNGSTAFAAAHPEIVGGLQALFNQDNGTGRIVRISAQGLPGGAERFAGWLSRVPSEITNQIRFQFPGTPSGGGSDHAAFVCHGAPGFSLGALSWNYGTYTWHTNRDTFDKIVMDDVRNNATLTAMLVYLASEDTVRTPRDRRVMPVDRSGVRRDWPACRTPRTWAEYVNR